MWPFGSYYPENGLEDIAESSFDYIVIGGGTAGCAVASRLSEDPAASVLLLERGTVHDSWLSRVPLTSCTFDAVAGSVHHISEPNEQCNGRRIRLVQSESVGGNSRINGMLYTRGAPAVYDGWAAKTGYADWAWDKVRPYFERLEKSGPLQIAPPSHAPTFELNGYIAKSAAAALGLPLIAQTLNDPEAPAAGHFYLDHTIDADGYRHSALRSYLSRDIANGRRGRLAVCTGVLATRLELDATRGVASGVYVKSLRRRRQPVRLMLARREVVLCGGAICTPQLLQLSGVGPRSLLERHAVPVKRDLAGVGAHLSDHWGVPICMEVPHAQTYHLMEQKPWWAAWQFLKFLFWGTGWMKTPAAQSAVFLNTTTTTTTHLGQRLDAKKMGNVPDVEIMVIPANAVPGSHPGRSLATLFACLLRPRSEGSVEIVSSDAEVRPEIRTNVFSSPDDLAVARKALRLTLRLAEHFMRESGYPHPARLVVAPGLKGKPEEEQQRPRDGDGYEDDELDDFARENVQAILHLACTCRMGKGEDGGVVDAELRVHGFQNLRVADASVFPEMPAAHTMAPVYMVAERCADFVRRTWQSNTNTV